MLQAIKHLFSTGRFMPHGMCYLWDSSLIRLHFLSDLLIGTAYVVISVMLGYFVYRAKRDIPFSWVFLGFGTFIIACGATHYIEVLTLWIPMYWLSGVVKLVTAIASVAIAVLLPPLLPKSLVLIQAANLSERRRADLELANQALELEIAERRKSEEKVKHLNTNLAELVRTRTVELSQVNEDLARLANAVDTWSEPAKTTDREGRITGWNAAAERLYGYRKEEILGHLPAMLVPAGLQAEAAELTARVRAGEQVVAFETTQLRKDGKQLYVSQTLTPVRNSAGEVMGASILVRDVTERRRAEEMFRIAVEAAPNAMIMVDAHGSIVLANAQTEKLFGYTRQELIGGAVDRLVPAQFRGNHPKHRVEFLNNPHARSMGAGRDLHGVRKDGSEFAIEIGLNPIQTESGTLVLSVIIDITHRKHAEEEIRRLNQHLEQRIQERTAELAAANKELEAFSYSVAHDLRAPLRSIDGFSQALLEDYADKLDSEGQDSLRRVRVATQRMARLIDDLLSLSQVARSEMYRAQINLSTIAAEIAADLREREPERSAEFVIEQDLCVSGDFTLLRVALENLLGNSWKYTSRRNRARIEFGRFQAEDGRTGFFVRDDGAGFDPRYAARLFGAFQRLHTTAEFSGTGIGLATVQRIIHRHGGNIWAESAVDKGATFFFTLSS